MYTLFIKRSLDFIVSLLLLIMFSPIFLLITFFLAFTTNGKPFFVQKRPGKNEKIFKILKFKTMNDKKDDQGNLLADKDRITPFGTFLRKTSLDEIPQLINVLKGEMSFIGPRPLLIQYLIYYTENEKMRHSILPGITGLAQVSGRNLLNWDVRLATDVEYVKRMSFALDVEILIKTVQNVITSKDIVVDPESIMPNLKDERSSDIVKK